MLPTPPHCGGHQPLVVGAAAQDAQRAFDAFIDEATAVQRG
jgi:hypothetical protein